MLRTWGSALILLLAFCFGPIRPCLAGVEQPGVGRGIEYLKAQAMAGLAPGEAALAGLAMVKAELPVTDPALLACLGRVGSTFAGGTAYTPARSGGPDIYEAACICLLLSNLDPVTYKPQIDAVAQFLVSRQLAGGCWDYSNRTAGDSSISQYAVLGLWEAENAGARVPPSTWDRAAGWYLKTQTSAGAWIYHPDEVQHPETVSMAAAGVGSLLICQRQLARYRKAVEASSPFLIPLVVEGAPARYEVSTTTASLKNAISRGVQWIGQHYSASSTPVMGQSPYYGLYGIERIGALAGKDSLGGAQWYETGQQFLLASQQASGNWHAQHGDVPNTAWAVLFLTKSTAKTMRRIEIKRLGGGTLVGGRGLPKDLTSLTVAGGRVLVRPMNGAIEGMLAVLEDPRAMNADSALAGLVARYQTEGPRVLRAHNDRFHKLLTDRDPGVRKVAAWALGHSGDLAVGPALIKAIQDEDDGVVAEARAGLQILSRKLEGLGPATGANADQKREAAKRWLAWYNETRPVNATGQDELSVLTTQPAPAAAAPAAAPKSGGAP